MGDQKTVNVILQLALKNLSGFTSVLQGNNYQVNYVEAGYDDLSQIDALPAVLLIVLDGLISVNDGDMFPYLDVEISLLKQRIVANKPTLALIL